MRRHGEGGGGEGKIHGEIEMAGEEEGRFYEAWEKLFPQNRKRLATERRTHQQRDVHGDLLPL